MSDDPYATLRGGVLSSVSGLMASTISSWGLQLGERKGDGHPRYSPADVVAVILMKQLALDATLKAARASFIVSEAQRFLPDLVGRVRREWAEAGRWTGEGGPYLVAGGGRHGDYNRGVKVALIEDADLAETIRGSDVPSLIIVPMRRIIKIAMIALDNHVRNERHAAAANGAVGEPGH